jgi:tetratricopeptide (TPR) repeat protein
VLLINPENIKTYAYRGLAESYTLDTAGMRTDFARAIKVSPKDETNYILRGKARMNSKDIAGAFRDFDIAIQLNPASGDAYYNRGLAKANQANGSACADLKKALELGVKDATDAIKRYCR